jgi:hypothetical protein
MPANLATSGSAAVAMLIPKFAEWPVWLQVAVPVVAWFATYPTGFGKTKRERRVRLVFKAGSFVFCLFFLHPSLPLMAFLLGLLALTCALLFVAFGSF